MTPSPFTGTVYFSDRLLDRDKYEDCYDRIIKILNRHKIKHGLLKATKDIWARDYMPVATTSGELIQFRYEPSYLKGREHLQSDPKEVLKANGIEAQPCEINLDGGNVVRCEDRVIIRDRIHSENPEYSDRKELLSELEDRLDAEVIIIPSLKEKHDMTGHADGMVRFVDRDTLLGNQRDQEYGYWHKDLEKVIKRYELEYIDVPTFKYPEKEYPESAIGCYVNYLEVGNLIVLPIFEVPGDHDQEVIDLFNEHFPTHHIEPININPIARQGGLMNCISWNG